MEDTFELSCNYRCCRRGHCLRFVHIFFQPPYLCPNVRYSSPRTILSHELIPSRGIVVSFFTGGAFCGAGLAGPAGDYLGRRWTIVIGCVVYLLGGALQTGAQNIHYLWAGRWIAGLGVGFLVMIIPIYQSEISHPSIRGRVTVCSRFGFFTSYQTFRASNVPLLCETF